MSRSRPAETWTYSWAGRSNTDCGLKIYSSLAVDHGSWNIISSGTQIDFANITIDREFEYLRLTKHFMI